MLSDNFYWLSTKPDVLDWAKKFEEVYTPESAYADLTGLNNLAPAKLNLRTEMSHDGKHAVVQAVVENPSSSLAFMVHLRLSKNGEDVVPIFWDDNYFSLLPGEKRQVSAQFDSAATEGSNLLLAVDGWNVTPIVNSLSAKEKAGKETQ